MNRLWLINRNLAGFSCSSRTELYLVIFFPSSPLTSGNVLRLKVYGDKGRWLMVIKSTFSQPFSLHTKHKTRSAFYAHNLSSYRAVLSKWELRSCIPWTDSVNSWLICCFFCYYHSIEWNNLHHSCPFASTFFHDCQFHQIEGNSRSCCCPFVPLLPFFSSLSFWRTKMEEQNSW